MWEKGRKDIKRKVIIVLVALLVILTTAFLVIQSRAKARFADKTMLGNIDVSGETLDELTKRVEDYSLTVVYLDENGNDAKETIHGADFTMTFQEAQSEISKVLEEQGIWNYITGNGDKYDIRVQYDKDKLNELVGKLGCFDAVRFTEPQNAYISDYMENTGYQIIPETRGNLLDEAEAYTKILEAVDRMDASVELSQEECYKTAEVTSDDEELNATLEQLNTYAGAKITYQFGETQEVVDGALISTWLKVNKKGKVKISEEKVEEYVAGLRRKYDTIFRSRRFKTSYGKTITITGGDYGWWMNYQKEEQELLKLIKAGKQVERTPEYYQTAITYGKKDYGDSYVEINLTTQHVFLYDKGKLVLETDCVSGNASRGYDTPVGTYSITYTERDATLDGENYSTPVKYWMPFNRNIGLHDASWRSSFGGEIYKYNGSHGCINLPPQKAAKIFEYVEKGTPVFCYKLNVEKKKNETVKSQSEQKKKSDNQKLAQKKKASNTSAKKKAAKKADNKKNNTKKAKQKNKKNNEKSRG